MNRSWGGARNTVVANARKPREDVPTSGDASALRRKNMIFCSNVRAAVAEYVGDLPKLGSRWQSTMIIAPASCVAFSVFNVTDVCSGHDPLTLSSKRQLMSLALLLERLSAEMSSLLADLDVNDNHDEGNELE